jgi:hypothetical protein
MTAACLTTEPLSIGLRVLCGNAAVSLRSAANTTSAEDPLDAPGDLQLEARQWDVPPVVGWGITMNPWSRRTVSRFDRVRR